MQNYKELLVWQKSHEFVISIYPLLTGFPKEETYNLVSQIKRASTSIPANIAEGAGRFTPKYFAHFLQNALGSSHEIEYLLLLSKDLGYMNIDSYYVHIQHINEIKAMLISLIQKSSYINFLLFTFYFQLYCNKWHYIAVKPRKTHGAINYH